jgi:hypothetical protein
MSATDALPAISPLRAAAREAFLYALPLTEIALIRGRLLDSGHPAGRFFPQKGLATSADRFVTTPNNDTIYANAFIDLRQGPATLTIPPLDDRYASLYLMDMFSNSIAVLGTRTTGPEGGTFTLVGPNDPAPAGALRSTTPWVWAMARVVVNGPDDTPAALALLHQFDCTGTPEKTTAVPGANRNGPWQAWFSAANTLLLENPPFATDRKILRHMAPLGLGSPDFNPDSFSPNQAVEIAAGVEDAKKMSLAAGFGGSKVGEWLFPAPSMGTFAQDYMTRARIAVAGLAALPTAEAMYITAYSPEGSPAFHGDGLWRLHFSKENLPPVDAFWSLTMYELEPTGALFLAPNSISRYSVGDRTPRLTREVDGGLSIWISRTDPAEGRSANWLPAPAKGPFVMILRTYMPKADLVMQRYVPPAVEKL